MATSFLLNTGATIPSVGLGTWHAEPGVVGDAVYAAVKAGYRHIDCARSYGNEKEVGLSLKKLFQNGVVKREDLFITSKLWYCDNAPEYVPEAIQTTLDDLQLEYLDLYLVNPRPDPSQEGNRAAFRELPPLRHPRYVGGNGGAARRRQGPRHRREQLLLPEAGGPARRRARASGRQPGRVPPGLAAGQAPRPVPLHRRSPLGVLTVGFARGGRRQRGKPARPPRRDIHRPQAAEDPCTSRDLLGPSDGPERAPEEHRRGKDHGEP